MITKITNSSLCSDDTVNFPIKINVFGNSVSNSDTKRYIQAPYPSKPITEPLQFNPKINKIPHLLNG
jgi:hypothetical protein